MIINNAKFENLVLECGKSKAKAARDAGLSVSIVQKIKVGASLSKRTVYLLAKSLNVDAAELLDNEVNAE